MLVSGPNRQFSRVVTAGELCGTSALAGIAVELRQRGPPLHAAATAAAVEVLHLHLTRPPAAEAVLRRGVGAPCRYHRA